MKWLIFTYWFVKSLLLSLMTVLFGLMCMIFYIPSLIIRIAGKFLTSEWLLLGDEIKNRNKK